MASICTRAKHSGGKAKGLGKSCIPTCTEDPRADMSCSPGLHKNIFLELSTKKPYPPHQVAGRQNTFVTNGSAAMQNFLTFSPGPDYSDFQQETGFELVASAPDDGSSLVTLPSEPSANLSQLAIE